MLQQCEFNGKRDVLHFKMLQAAINENNTKKIENQREKNLSEKLFLPQKGLEQSVEKNDEESDNSGDEKMLYFKNTKSPDAENDGDSRHKKRKILSSCVSSYGSEPYSKKRSKKHHSSKMKSVRHHHHHHKHVLPLSKNQKLHKNCESKESMKERKARSTSNSIVK